MFESWNIHSDRGNKNWSNDLRNEMQISVKNNIQILKLVARCIYGVRKQVFHEAPKTEDFLERVNISKSALLPITLGCLKSFVTH